MYQVYQNRVEKQLGEKKNQGDLNLVMQCFSSNSSFNGVIETIRGVDVLIISPGFILLCILF